MREAPAIAIIERLLGAGRDGARLRSGGAADGAARVRRSHRRSATKSYDALQGADALAIVTEWNEFREPDFEQMQAAPEAAGRLRRPQHLLARADARARLHLPLHWPLTRGACWSPAAPATSAATPARRSAGAGYEVVVYDNLVAGHREAVRYGELVEGDIADLAAVRQALARAPASGGDALCRVPRRRRVGPRAGEVLPQQRRRRADRARGDGGRVGAPLRVLVDLRHLRRAERDADSARRIRSARSTATARRSWRSSGRCRTSSAPTASAGWRCATSTPPAPIRTARSARTIRRRST